MERGAFFRCFFEFPAEEFADLVFRKRGLGRRLLGQGLCKHDELLRRRLPACLDLFNPTRLESENQSSQSFLVRFSDLVAKMSHKRLGGNGLPTWSPGRFSDNHCCVV